MQQTVDCQISEFANSVCTSLQALSPMEKLIHSMFTIWIIHWSIQLTALQGKDS